MMSRSRSSSPSPISCIWLVFRCQIFQALRMDWFYVSDNQQRGPVAEAQMEELVQSGVVGPDTLVWRRGLGEWQPLHAVWSSGTSTPPPTLVATAVGIGGATCAECGQVFSHSDMV